MADDSPDSPFYALDRVALWRRVRLTRVDAAALTGATERQLAYWTSKGIVHQGPDHRYDSAALETILLIRQALEDGQSLGRAQRLLEAYRRERPDADPGAPAPTVTGTIDPEFASRLRRAAHHLNAALARIGDGVRAAATDELRSRGSD